MSNDKKDNDFRLRRCVINTSNKEDDMTPALKLGEKIRLYEPPGFEKYSDENDPDQAIQLAAQSGSNLCCCDSVCACHAVDAKSCACHEVCTCHDVCTCDSQCSCVSDTCHCNPHGGGCTLVTYTYSTYNTYVF
jgi:hypothetical protein